MYYQEVNWLPDIPSELLDDWETIKNRGNIFKSKRVEGIYASYLVSSKLRKFLQSYFDKPINVRYQVINDQLPVHIDAGGIFRKFNYLLDAGGESVFTRWWDSLDNPSTIVYQCQAQEFTWHQIKVNHAHDISPIKRTRLSIEIHEPAKSEHLDEMPNW
jgi:hypothetical protein